MGRKKHPVVQPEMYDPYEFACPITGLKPKYNTRRAVGYILKAETAKLRPKVIA